MLSVHDDVREGAAQRVVNDRALHAAGDLDIRAAVNVRVTPARAAGVIPGQIDFNVVALARLEDAEDVGGNPFLADVRAVEVEAGAVEMVR